MKTYYTKTIMLTVLAAAFLQLRSAAGPGFPEDTDLKAAALTVLQKKCNVCHRSANPRRVFTQENMEDLAPKIYKQVFVRKRMPKGRDIKLTDTETQVLQSWLATRLSIQP